MAEVLHVSHTVTGWNGVTCKRGLECRPLAPGARIREVVIKVAKGAHVARIGALA